jgi:hypothetical protein
MEEGAVVFVIGAGIAAGLSLLVAVAIFIAVRMRA